MSLSGTLSINPQRKIVILGHTGSIGGALFKELQLSGHQVLGFSRNSQPKLALDDEASIQAVAQAAGTDIDWLINATGVLSDRPGLPERSLKELSATAMVSQFLVNAVGPALVIKHFLPNMRKHSAALMACFSARVASISDNRLGGWYSYRASKAALNQLIKTASIEISRSHPKMVCVGVHPGTVDSTLSRPFIQAAKNVQTPAEAARKIMTVLESLTSEHTGTLVDYQGKVIAW